MKSLFKAFATVTLISILTRLCSFVFKIYLSRKLGAETLGLYQICLSVLGLFACISASGLPITLSRITAETTSLGNNKEQFRVFSTCLLISLGFAILFCTLLLCFPTLLAKVFSDERCINLFYLMMPMLITISLYSIIRGWFWGKKDFLIFSAVEFGDEAIKIILCLFLFSGIAFKFSPLYSYAYAMVVADIIIVVILIILFFKKGGKLHKPSVAKPIIKSATPLTITRIFGSLTSTFLSLSIPVLLIKNMGLTSAQATAEFGRASGMVMPLIFTPSSIIGSLSVVLIPEIASQNAKKNINSLSGKLSSSILFSTLVSCGFFVLFSSMGKDLGVFLYKDVYSGIYLEKSAVLMIPMGINGLVISILNSLGKEKHTFITHICGCGVLVACTYIIAPFLGIYTYFCVLIIFHTLTMIVNLVILSKFVSLPFKMPIQCMVAVIFSYVLSSLIKLVYCTIKPSCGMILSMFVCGMIAVVIFSAYLIIFNIDTVRNFLDKKKSKLPRKKLQALL